MLNFGATHLQGIFKYYNAKRFFSDISAGVVVGIVALPLAIAFGVASQVSPINAIYATILGGFVIAILSGSKVQIGGPTGACVVIIYSISIRYGTEGLVIATFIAGLILIAMGVLRMGSLIKLIPDPLTEGFTAGIAVDLFASQIKDLFGLKMGKLPIDFIGKIWEYFLHFQSLSVYALGIGLLTIIINQLSPYFVTKKLPGPILAITITSIAAYFLHLPIETIGTRFGQISPTLPTMAFHLLNFKEAVGLIRPAFAIAVLVSIMSLVSGVVAESKTGYHLRSNKELVAEGIANILSSVIGGIPVTGSIARTMTNIENGGNSRMAGVVQSLVLILVVIVAGKWISYIPVASIAGLLIVIAYNMSKWRKFLAIIYAKSSDSLLMVVTFAITIFIDLTLAIEIGFAFATILFMRSMSKISNVKELTNNFLADNGIYLEEQMVNYDMPKGVAVFEINGPLFFGAAYKFKESLMHNKNIPSIVIVRLRNVPIIDSTGVNTLLKVASDLKAQNIQLVLSEFSYKTIDIKLCKIMLGKLGRDNVQGTLKQAVARCEAIFEEHSKFC